jgi:exopolysaccharide biosynthesis WecB/TagA/CpsF family protein
MRISSTYRAFKRVVDVVSSLSFLVLSLGTKIWGRKQSSTYWLKNGQDLFVGRKSLIGTSADARQFNGVIHESGLSEAMNLELSSKELDNRYLERITLAKDCKILFKAIWVYLLSGKSATTERTDFFNLFGIFVNNSTTKSILKTIAGMIETHPLTRTRIFEERQLMTSDLLRSAEPQHVCFVNANNFNLALKQRDYRISLRKADLVLPDGIGVKLALRICGGTLRKNLNGTDLFPFIAEYFAENQFPIYLLGASNEVLEKASQKIRSLFPGIAIAGVSDGYFSLQDEEALCSKINESGAYGLIIGMGTPRQELWVERNRERLNLPIIFSMGGLLDFLGEKNRRAPLWMRQTGLEWVYRLYQEPRRMWKRYIVGNPAFLYNVYKWKSSNAQTIAKQERNAL